MPEKIIELLDIYDSNRVKTGKIVERAQPFLNDAYILIVHVCIFNPEGRLLIQHRHSDKNLWPDRWDVGVGGSAVSGETNKTAAEREVLEELGYQIDLSIERPYFTINFDWGFADYFLIDTADIIIDELTLQEDEVQAVKWADKEEVLSMIESGEFIPYKKSIIEMIFEMHKSRGETY